MAVFSLVGVLAIHFFWARPGDPCRSFGVLWPSGSSPIWRETSAGFEGKEYQTFCQVGDQGLTLVHTPAHRCRVTSESAEAGVKHVDAPPLWVGVTEISRQQWSALVPTEEDLSIRRSGGPLYENEALRMITWCDAVSYANRVSEAVGLADAYSGVSDCSDTGGQSVAWDESSAGFRLPTATEWECFVRAGTYGRYWGGNDVDDLARTDWYRDNRLLTVPQVGLRPPNPFGLADVLGSVSEHSWSVCSAAEVARSAWGQLRGSGGKVGLARRVMGGNVGEDGVHAEIDYVRCEEVAAFGLWGIRLVRN